jgi:hypothetical protein
MIISFDTRGTKLSAEIIEVKRSKRRNSFFDNSFY